MGKEEEIQSMLRFIQAAETEKDKYDIVYSYAPMLDPEAMQIIRDDTQCPSELIDLFLKVRVMYVIDQIISTSNPEGK